MYQIDAFTDSVLSGNPAAVVPLETWLRDDLMQAIAAENNLSETAFIVGEFNVYEIRWFTPTNEVDLCGHATLAAAHCLYSHYDLDSPVIRFQSRSGELRVKQTDTGYQMDFPKDQPRNADPMKAQIRAAIGVAPVECLKGRDDYAVILANEDAVLTLQPDLQQIAKLDARGLLVSAPGKEFDFVSRCFFPAFGIDEDPVTGSAHTLLGPYWSKVLGKNPVTGFQMSKRGGKVSCEILENRVLLEGEAVTFMTGKISISDVLL